MGTSPRIVVLAKNWNMAKTGNAVKKGVFDYSEGQRLPQSLQLTVTEIGSSLTKYNGPESVFKFCVFEMF